MRPPKYVIFYCIKGDTFFFAEYNICAEIFEKIVIGGLEVSFSFVCLIRCFMSTVNS